MCRRKEMSKLPPAPPVEASTGMSRMSRNAGSTSPYVLGGMRRPSASRYPKGLPAAVQTTAAPLPPDASAVKRSMVVSTRTTASAPS